MYFLVCKKQDGEGCDHTIGCGMRYDIVCAESIEEAVTSIIWPDGSEKSDTLHGKQALTEVLIVPYHQVHICNIAEYKAIIDDDIREKELAELTRLQAKYKGHLKRKLRY